MKKAKKYRIGFTTGVFDLLHIGHLNLLEKCKEQCSYLIVAVCDDEYVREVKHKEPIYSLEERVRLIDALKVVDEVVTISTKDIEDKTVALKKYKFDVLFSGDDWKGTERYIRTEKQFAELGAAIEYLPYTKNISTTEIKNIIKGEK